jgi:hypothetical protein
MSSNIVNTYNGFGLANFFFPDGSARRGNVAAQQANPLHTGPVRPAAHKSCILKQKQVLNY